MNRQALHPWFTWAATALWGEHCVFGYPKETRLRAETPGSQIPGRPVVVGPHCLLANLGVADPPALLGAGFGISRATAYRYHDEAVTVLAAQAPDLHDALQRAAAEGMAYVILDGKIFSADRCSQKTTSVKGTQIDLWYSGKAHEHGGNVQALSAPDGFPLWVADVEPGSVHDLTVARDHVLGALYWAASHLKLPTLADGGYDGCGIGVHTPIKQPTGDQALATDNRAYNTLLRGLRCLGERGFAVPTGRWRALHHFTASPSKIGGIVQAALVLTEFEQGRLA